MNKLFFQLILLLLTITFTACSKTPFKEQKLQADSALVYIYVAEDDSINDTYRNSAYKINLNGIRANDSIGISEYMPYKLNSDNLIVTATRGDIETQKLKLQLEAGKAYFLRVRSFSDDFGKFKFEVVDKAVALNEIRNATLAAKIDKKEEFINSLMQKEETNKSLSKMDEIQKAYKLKKDGVITEEEFKKLKADILAK